MKIILWIAGILTFLIIAAVIVLRVVMSNNHVKYDSLNYTFPSALTIEGLSIDQPETIVLSAGRIHADWSWLSLLKGKPRADLIELESIKGIIRSKANQDDGEFSVPSFSLGQLTGDDLHVLFLSGQDSMDFDVDGLRIFSVDSDGRIKADSLLIEGAGVKILPGQKEKVSEDTAVFSLEGIPGFDIHHLEIVKSRFLTRTDSASHSISDLDMVISGWKSDDLLSMQVGRLDFVYQDTLDMNLVLEEGKLNKEFASDLRDISIGLPGTQLVFDRIRAELGENFDIQVDIGRSYVSLGTLREFVPAVNEWVNPRLPDQQKIYLNARVHADRDSIHILEAGLELPDNIETEMAGYVLLDSVKTDIYAEKLGLNARGVDLDRLLREQDYHEFFIWPDQLNVEATASYVNDSLSVGGNLLTSAGDIRLDLSLDPLSSGGSRFKLSAFSEALQVSRLTGISPVEIQSAGLDYRMSLITGTATNGSSMEIEALVKDLLSMDTKIDSIDYHLQSLEEGQQMQALILDDSLKAAAGLFIPTDEDTWSEFTASIDTVYPSMFVDVLHPGKWKSELEGRFIQGEEKFRLEGMIRETTLETDSLRTTIADLQADLMFSESSLQASLSSEGSEKLSISTGLEFPEFQTNLTAWLSKLPDMEVSINTDLNPVVLTWLTGKKTRAGLEGFQVEKNGENLRVEGAIPSWEYGEWEGEKVSVDFSGESGRLEGAFKLATLDHPELELEELVAEVNLSPDTYQTRLSFEFADTLGGFNIPLLTEIRDDGYLLRFQPEEKLVISDADWTIVENEGILLTDSLTIERGSLGIQQGNTSLHASTQGEEVSLEIEALNASPLLSWLLKTDEATASLDASAVINTATGEVIFTAGSEKIAAGEIPPVALELEGSLRDELLKADARIYNDSLSLDASVQRENETIDYELALNSFDLEILPVLPFWPEDAEIEGLVSGRMEGTLGNEISNQGYLVVEEGRFDFPSLPSELFIAEDSVLFTGHVLDFRNFVVLDKNDHQLEIEGELDYYPELAFSFSIQSKRFSFIDEDKPEMIGGDLQVNADLAIEGNPEKISVRGNLETIEGGKLVYITQGGFDMVDPTQIITFMDLDGKDSISVSTRDKGPDVEWDVDIELARTDLEVILDEVSQENLQVEANGRLNLVSGSGLTPRVFGDIQSDGGSAFLQLPAVPDMDLIIEQAQIRWDGPLDDPTIDFTGYQIVRTRPQGLSPQFSDRTDPVGFKVLVKLNNASLSELDVNFDLEGGDAPTREYISGLPPETRQTYAINLLVFGRIGTEDNLDNPVLVDQITSKLNEISRRNLKNTDLSFDANTYDDERTGPGESRTDINYSLSREFLNSRLSFSVGGNVGVYSNDPAEAPPPHLLGNVEVQYRLSNSPPLILKGSHEEVYEGVIDGDINKTSVGLSYQRSWKRFTDIFRRKERRNKDE